VDPLKEPLNGVGLPIGVSTPHFDESNGKLEQSVGSVVKLA
jgi:hypothetical protein